MSMPSATTARYAAILLLFGMFFNALLAIVNANITTVNTSHVIAMEGLTMLGIAALALRTPMPGMKPWLAFSGLFVILFLFILLHNAMLGQEVSPKALRDIVLVSAFGILGMVYHHAKGNLPRLLAVISCLVLAVLMLEYLSTDLFSKIFNVLSYYVNTRGFEEKTATGLEDFSLFFNTQLVEGRFTLGFLSTHRLSSLFLEQTTLGNFAAVLAMATSVLWDKLNNRQRLLLGTTIVLSIAGTDSRIALGITVLTILVHLATRSLPRGGNLFVMPALLGLSWLFFYDPTAISITTDDLPGRFGWSLTQLSWIDLQGAFGGHPELIGRSMDSGYTYMIYSQTILGMVAFWLFTSLIVPQTTPASKRLAYLVSIFLAINLMTGPTVLSIKTAALLWFLVGYVYRESLTGPAKPTKA